MLTTVEKDKAVPLTCLEPNVILIIIEKRRLVYV